MLLARKGEATRADGGKFLDLDGLYPVNITLDIRRADAGERNMADIGELELMRREEVAHRTVERGERVLGLDAQHIDDRKVGGEADDLRAGPADVDA